MSLFSFNCTTFLYFLYIYVVITFIIITWSCILVFFTFFFLSICTLKSMHYFICPANIYSFVLPVYLCIITFVWLCVRTVKFLRLRPNVLRIWSFSSWSERAGRMRRRRPTLNNFSGRSLTTNGALSPAR